MPILTTIAYAFGTLTSDATIPTAADTVTIAGKVYTFRAHNTVTTVDGDVDLGTTAAEALTNLKAAINAGSGAGTLYGSLTPANEHVVATTLTATTLKVVCKVPGKIGNFVTTTEASSHLAWGGTVLASGAGLMSTAINDIITKLGPRMNSEILQALKSIDADAAAD
jgi:hypothetical protein